MPKDAPQAADPALAQRLTELEIKACYADDLLDHLNRQVAEQQATIDRLVELVRQLRRQVDEPSRQSGLSGVSDERPPHW